MLKYSYKDLFALGYIAVVKPTILGEETFFIYEGSFEDSVNGTMHLFSTDDKELKYTLQGTDCLEFLKEFGIGHSYALHRQWIALNENDTDCLIDGLTIPVILKIYIKDKAQLIQELFNDIKPSPYV